MFDINNKLKTSIRFKYYHLLKTKNKINSPKKILISY